MADIVDVFLLLVLHVSAMILISTCNYFSASVLYASLPEVVFISRATYVIFNLKGRAQRPHEADYCPSGNDGQI